MLSSIKSGKGLSFDMEIESEFEDSVDRIPRQRQRDNKINYSKEKLGHILESYHRLSLQFRVGDGGTTWFFFGCLSSPTP